MYLQDLFLYFLNPCTSSYSPGAKYCFRDLLHPLYEKVTFEFDRSYIIFAMGKSMLNVPVLGNVLNIGH